MHFIAYILAFLLGFFGALFAVTWLIVGTLRVDTSDEDGPYLFLEVDKDKVDMLGRSSYVILRVDRSDYISQK